MRNVWYELNFMGADHPTRPIEVLRKLWEEHDAKYKDLPYGRAGKDREFYSTLNVEEQDIVSHKILGIPLRSHRIENMLSY